LHSRRAAPIFGTFVWRTDIGKHYGHFQRAWCRLLLPPRTETAGAGVMWDWGTLLSLFLLGFFGGTHCVGMCGGLSSAFALQLPPHIRRVWLILLMNCGRIASYVLIGALMGLLSGMGSLLNETHTLQIVLLVLANILLLLMGLYLAGLSDWANKTEWVGRWLWRKMQPALQKLLPIRSYAACFGVGALWGWLPCGLVYNASLFALSSGSAGTGALYLLAFGLGTLPNLLAMGIFAAQLQRLVQQRSLRLITGLLMSAWACRQLWVAVQAALGG
jgi:hypothetical protein